MLTPFTSNQFSDADGNPAGGSTYGPGFAISWQNGPLGAPDDPDRQEPNGAFVETVIKAAADRIEFYQASRFASADNQEALDHLNAALDALDRRTRARTERGVEGTHTV
jgi:hypothetical protein